MQPTLSVPKTSAAWLGGEDHWRERQRAKGLISVVFQIHLMDAYKYGFCKCWLETKLEA